MSVLKKRVNTSLTIALISLEIIAALMAVFMVVWPSLVNKQTIAAASVKYYIDCSAVTNGTGTQSNPFNNLSSVNKNLTAGSLIYLKKGTICKNQKLYISSSGQSGSPITFSSYGTATTKPIIDGENKIDFGIQINNANYITIKNIIVKNISNANTTSSASGILVQQSNNIILTSVEVLDSFGSAGIFILYNNGQGGYQINSSKVIGMKGTSAHPYSAGGGVGISIFPYGDNSSLSSSSTNNNLVSGNTVSGNEGSGIGIYNSANTQIIKNNVYNNGGSGIYLGGSFSHDCAIETNKVYQNAQKIDDLYGIDLLQVGDNNVVRYNLVHDHHDTIADSNVIVNPGNPQGSPKYGSGGIRFDGGIPNTTTWNRSGNKAYYNLIYGEMSGMAILNFNNVTISNNVIYNSSSAGMYLLAYNDAKKEFGGAIIKNNIIHTAPYMVKFSSMINSSVDGEKNIFNNNIYYNNASTVNFAWGISEMGYTQSLNFNEWSNRNLSTPAWTQYSEGSTKYNIWYTILAKNPAAVYFGNNLGTRSISEDPLNDLKQPGCANKWSWIAAGSSWYLAVCSDSSPKDIGYYYSNIKSGSEAYSKNINPKISTTNKSFRPSTGSPVIDAGSEMGVSPDYAGVQVPINSKTDIGAYESCTISSQCTDLFGSLYQYCKSGRCCTDSAGTSCK